ncbi:MAG: hypothetical protein V4637_03740 [Pseudomonadota bacterium]
MAPSKLFILASPVTLRTVWAWDAELQVKEAKQITATAAVTTFTYM